MALPMQHFIYFYNNYFNINAKQTTHARKDLRKNNFKKLLDIEQNI